MQRRTWLFEAFTSYVASAAACSGVVAWAHAQAAPVNARPPVQVAAASDLQLALPSLLAQFERETGYAAQALFGASGALARQLAQGLPMDLFMSADQALVARLHQQGWAQDAGVVYAQGRLVLLASSAALGAGRTGSEGKRKIDPPQLAQRLFDSQLTGLADFEAALGKNAKFAIANPDHAPYGQAARAALQQAGVWAALQPHLVLGENVSQAMQFVASGSAQLGLGAASLSLAPRLQASTRQILVDERLYPALLQRMALRLGAADAAQALYRWLQTPKAQAALAEHGFKPVFDAKSR